MLCVNILLQYIKFNHGFLKSLEISIMQLSICFNYTFKARNAAVAIVHLVSNTKYVIVGFYSALNCGTLQ